MGFVERFVAVSLRQRLFVLLCLCAIVATGIVAYRDLPVEAFPDLTETYALLGLRVRANAAMIDLDEGDATKVQLRDSIMGPPTTAQYPLRPAN